MDNDNSTYRVIVVLPIYKPFPDLDELMSLAQCLKVLNKQTICIVCPYSLDTTFYQSIANKYGKEFMINTFPDHYFNGIEGYNHLLLSSCFYKRFKSYTHILLYQLDAWVFRDELLYWCNMGYDYIGAPWFEHYSCHEEGCELWTVGNGGFSLRSVPYFLRLTTHIGSLKSASTLNLNQSFKHCLYRALYSIGYQNNIRYYRKDSTLYEDVFFSVFLKGTRFEPNLPPVREAIEFAFEKSPSYLFSVTGKLPFGCHAWKKNEYDSFWVRYIC